MPDIETLRALEARVGAASGADREIDREIEHVICGVPRPPSGMQMVYPRRVTESLDVAVALVESSGFGWQIDQDDGCVLSDSDDCYDYVKAKTPPLSVCLALIRALIARAEHEGEATPP